jgi:hypothetical protein
MLHEIVATAQLRRAIVQQFDARGQDCPIGKKEAGDAEELLSLLPAATVKITGDTAEITFDGGTTMQVIKKENKWKIHYDKSQQAMGGLPTKEEVAAAKRRAAAIEQLTTDIAARRFANIADIEARYNTLTAPATRPAMTKP